MKILSVPFLLIVCLHLTLSSCEKRRVAKRLEGTWLVKSYTRANLNMLQIKDSVFLFSPVCDTFKVETRSDYTINYIFKRDGEVSRKSQITKSLPDLNSPLDGACNPRFTTASFDSLITGKWVYAEGGSLAIEFPLMVDNINMSFNNDEEMVWEQVIQIDTGILKFSGVERFLLQKQR